MQSIYYIGLTQIKCKYQDQSLLEYMVIYFGRWIPKFWRDLQPSSSR